MRPFPLFFHKKFVWHTSGQITSARLTLFIPKTPLRHFPQCQNNLSPTSLPPSSPPIPLSAGTSILGHLHQSASSNHLLLQHHRAMPTPSWALLDAIFILIWLEIILKAAANFNYIEYWYCSKTVNNVAAVLSIKMERERYEILALLTYISDWRN